ncbi:MAG TPA: ABC transporter permease [Candidatus Nanopelagicales bacterium]|jgi:ABC-2 type transport system permease protein
MSSNEPAALADHPFATAPDATARGPRAPRRGAFARLLGSELRLVFRRRRNLALLIVLAGPPVLIGIAVKTSAPHGGNGFFGQITGNGLFLVYTALTVSLPLFLPLAVGVVAGDSIAGEAGSGTLRYLLTIPVGRARLLAAKALSVLVFVTAAVLVVAVSGLVTGWVLFGLRDLTLLSGDTVSLADGLLRTAALTLYIVVALTGLIAIGMFISTLTEVPIAAMAATVAATIIVEVLDAVPQIGSARSWLFTHNWLGFGELLRSDVEVRTLVGWSMLQVAYVVVFGALAWARFTTKDITS